MSEIVYTKYFDPLGMKIKFMSNGCFFASMDAVGDSPEFKTFDDAVEWLHSSTPALEELPEFLQQTDKIHDAVGPFSHYLLRALAQVNSPLKEICQANIRNVLPSRQPN